MGKSQEQDNGKLKSVHHLDVDIPGSVTCKISCIVLAALRDRRLTFHLPGMNL